MVLESIRYNIPALSLINQIRNTDNRLQTNIEHLGTGLRINSAKDDAGGFVLSSRLESQFRGLDQASANAQDGINLANVVDSSLGQIVSLLQDIQTSTLAAANTGTTDRVTRQSYQNQIQEKLDEINKIANQTRFNDKYVLNGTYGSTVGFRSGTRNFGGSVAFGPNSTLFSGNAFLKFSRDQSGSAVVKSGSDAVFNTGITLRTDLAISVGQLDAVTAGGDFLSTLTFNRVTLANNDTIMFSGLIANGATPFSGLLTLSAGVTTVNDLMTAIQNSIDSAETIAGVEAGGTNPLETTVGLNIATRRLQFYSAAQGTPSQFNINFTVKNNTGNTKTTFGSDRVATILHSTATNSTNAKIGNNLSAITGSTFGSGTFDISIANVMAAANRVITANSGFFSNVSLTTPVGAATAINNTYLGTFTLQTNDTLTINGTVPDGTTFTSVYTVGASAGPGDGLVATYQDLIDELKHRNRTSTSYGFNLAVATLTAAGYIQLVDDIAATSSTDLSFTLKHPAGTTYSVNSSVTTAGNRETATVSIAGGTAQTVVAGQVVTLEGGNIVLPTEPTPQLTLRIGSGLTQGSDQITLTEQKYSGSLNGGTSVQFRNGQQNVVFTAGAASVDSIEANQQVTLNFDRLVTVTSSPSQGGEMFILSSNSRELNFHIGGNRDEDKLFLLADLRTKNLGTDTTNNLDSINVTSITGANNALTIVNDALNQVNTVQGRVGAFADRLNNTVQNLDFSSLNLQTARNRIVSADIARETTEMAFATVLMQSQTAVLVQANMVPEKVFAILFGIK